MLPNPALFDPTADFTVAEELPELVLPSGTPVLNPVGLDDTCALLPLPDGGAVVVWPRQVSRHAADGTPRWRVAGRELVAALHPSAPEVALFAHLPGTEGGELTRYDLATGQLLGTQPLPRLRFATQLLWLPDGRLLALTLHALGWVEPTAGWQPLWPPPGAEPVGLTGLVWRPDAPGEVLLLAGHAVLALDLATGRVLRQQATRVGLPSFRQAAAPPALAGYQEVAVLDGNLLTEKYLCELSGPGGVRYAHEYEGDGVSWHPQAAASPDGRWLLASNGAGQLWLLDLAAAAAPPRRFRAALAPYVLAVAWRSATSLLVLGHLGRLCCLDLAAPAPLWEADTLRPADVARLLLDAPPEAAPRPPAPPMLDTLAALQTAATPAAYLAAVQALDPCLTPADWAALPLTPAHLTAALRYFGWYRPEAGFDLAPLAAMRQQLTELEVRASDITATMTLALHDQLLQAHELLPGKLPDHTTQELRQRYYNVLDEVEFLNPPEDQGPRWPAPGTPARATLEAAFEAAEALLQSFDVGGSPHLLKPVVEQLAARFPQQFRQRLLALTATEQLFFLHFFDLSAQPALLRELAASPHKPVRQQATRLLRKLGL